jgi:hypothetical protein
MAVCTSNALSAVPIIFDNLTDCTVGTVPPSISLDVPGIVRGNVYPSLWVPRLDGIGGSRFQLSETHLETLRSAIQVLAACDGLDALDPAGGKGQCCADVSDLLEAASILSDVVALTIQGNYSGEVPLALVEAMAKAPVADNGE